MRCAGLQHGQKFGQKPTQLFQFGPAEGPGQFTFDLGQKGKALQKASTSLRRKPNQFRPAIVGIRGSFDDAHGFQFFYKLTDGLFGAAQAFGQRGQPRTCQIDVRQQQGVRLAQGLPGTVAHSPKRLLVPKARALEKKLRQVFPFGGLKTDPETQVCICHVLLVKRALLF